MRVDYNFYDQLESPNIILCNPNKRELYYLGNAYDTNIKPRYNALSEFSFIYPEIVNGIKDDAYPYLAAKRLVFIENVGYFKIVDVTEDMEGMVNTKKVTAYSLEVELNGKKVIGLSGTYKFYDVLDTPKSLLHQIIRLIPSWAIGTVDASLMTKARTFDVSENSVYNFLMSDVENAYECIFTFDTINKKINALARDKATIPTDIYLSFDNLIKNVSMKSLADEITTCLNVYGAGDLDIRTVNPLGNTKIYNFGTYKHLDWMSAALIEAIDAWQTKIIANQTPYANLLKTLKEKNILLGTDNNKLAKLKSELLAIETKIKVRIENNEKYDDLTPLRDAKVLEINGVIAEITTLTTQIKMLRDALTVINTSLKIETNFTEAQIAELSPYIVENTYQNENFIQTNIMTPAEIQDMAQDLYNQGVDVLKRLCLPQYEFKIDVANPLFLKAFKPLVDQIELGCTVTVDLDKDYLITVALLEMSFSYDHPEDCTLTFSSKLRLDNGNFIFAELFGKAIKAGGDVSFDKYDWGEFNDYKNGDNGVSDLINGFLDVSKNNVINNSDNTEIVIGPNGLRGKRWLPDDKKYDKYEVWLMPTTLAFTKDNWNTASAAIGLAPNGQYGVVADVICGTLLAGNALTIQNKNAVGDVINFKLDALGCKLENADFTIFNNKNKILLSPATGIKIETKVDDNWQPKFYVDGNGNLTFSGALKGATGEFTGKITATSGSIGGFTIEPKGLYSPDKNNYLLSTGDLQWGALTIKGDQADFRGTIHATHLEGQIVNDQVANDAINDEKVSDLNAGKVNAGWMSADRIHGGTITWGDGVGELGVSGTGVGTMRTNNVMGVYGGIGAVEVRTGRILLSAGGGGEVYAGGVGDTLRVLGNLTVDYRGAWCSGESHDIYVGKNYRDKVLYFRKGVYVGYDEITSNEV
jgi:hypothetical protein